MNYVTLGGVSRYPIRIEIDDTSWIRPLLSSGWKIVNPHSFLNDFDKWWAFELKQRGLDKP